ncbi:MAG: hypothetical protein DRJ67_10465 [Thermoprotei archaeon]|nr:MAG: hypothetical protein DRJ67_10465 [Thermoprotei archaeon]
MSGPLPSKPLDVIIPPVAVNVEGARVIILEVIRYTRFDGAKRYIVSCQVEWGGYRSPRFQLDVADNAELERKLRVEVSKMQLMVVSGYTTPFQRVR